MRWIGIGDLHFDGPLIKYRPDLNELICNDIEKAFQYARSNGVGNVFFYGDISHRPTISMDAMIRFYTQLASNKDFEFHILAGNHDYNNCLIAKTTYRSNGIDVALEKLFDLSNVNRLLGPRWLGQFAAVDTHSNDGSIKRQTAQLFYGGAKPITKVVLENGAELEGHNHPVFVLVGDEVVVKKIEELLPGDVLLTKKTA